MEKLTAKKRLTMVKQYLSGLSYNEIAAKTGTSKGTVANVVTEIAFRPNSSKCYCIGAHYNSFSGTVGADDNASGSGRGQTEKA